MVGFDCVPRCADIVARGIVITASTMHKADLTLSEAPPHCSIKLLLADVVNFEKRLSTKIERARAGTIKWVIGVGVAQAATILAVLRLFPGHP
jgi:hypothetical protein